MKKLAFLAALAVMTTQASAASLTWGYGGGYLYIAKPGDAKAVQAYDFKDEIPDGSQFVLLYLGTASTFDVGSITDSQVVDRLDFGTVFDGDDSYAKPASKQFAVSEGTYNKNDYFGIAFYNGTGYTSIYAVTDYDEGTIGGALSPTIKIDNLDQTADFSLYASDGGPKDSYQIHMAGVTVPEPSVALMGLLGLGMLLKRRKA